MSREACNAGNIYSMISGFCGKFVSHAKHLTFDKAAYGGAGACSSL